MSQMLPPTLSCCHSTHLWPITPGLNSTPKLLLLGVCGRLNGEEEWFRFLSLFPSLWVHLYPSPSALSKAAELLIESSSTMERGELLAVCVLCWCCSVCVVTAIQRADLFPYGSLSGDLILAEGDDETSRVLTLPKPFYFYDSHFSQLYVSQTP